MKILLLVDDYMPGSIKIAAVMMHDLAKELQHQGHNVTVCTPDDSIINKYHLDEFEGIPILRFKLGTIKNVSKVKRAINETLLSYKAWHNLKPFFQDNQHDLIVYYSPTIFFGGLVSRLKSLWKCRAFLVLRDFFPQWTVDNGLIKEGSLIHRYFKYFESISYKAADVIAVQSPSNKLYFQKNKEYRKHVNKVDVLYNWSDVSIKVENNGLYRKKLGLMDKVVFFYGGNIGHAQDMLNIVRLAKNLIKEKKAHFVLVGKGDEVELVRAAIEDYHLDNMTLLPPVSQDEFKLMLAEFDIGLFSLNKDHTTHNFPGKLLGYMVQEKPILGSVNPDNDLKSVIETANAGFVSVNGEDVLLKENALKLIRDEVFRQQMGKAAKQLLHDLFSVESAVDKILNSRK